MRHFILRSLCDLLDLFLPPACPLCTRALPSPTSTGICPACISEIPSLSGPQCPRCALPYAAEQGSNHACETCLRDPNPCLDWTAAAGLYAGPLREAIHRFKYRGATTLDRPLAKLLLHRTQNRIEDLDPELIIPVPLHPTRLRERTYNQSLLLARALGSELKVPVPAKLLCRINPTASQQGRDAQARAGNLKNAFALSSPLQAKRILLIDDVMTTGATARECAKTLRRAGATSIAALVLGRTAKNSIPFET